MKLADTYKFVLGIVFKKRLKRLVLFVLMYIGTAALNFITFDKYGDDEYMTGIVVCGIVPYLACVVAGLFFTSELSSNRLVRSCPAAKTIFTRTVCGAVGIIYAIGAALTIVVRAAGVIAGTGEMCALSDLLIALSASAVLAALIPLAIMIRSGIFVLCYLPLVLISPVIILLTSIGAYNGGFGLPLWAAALVFVGICAAFYALARAAAVAIYKRMNFYGNQIVAG